ncbi:double-strand break repair protein AddB [Rhodobium gokarnense]|uniref:ATP-dependent helicase/nuclease subunit B n=1 Tax=Rhodobium gokarnense TaxID=364296 RepID=A0ABT3HEG9_9HYPH|nr:double-strand break repair protein AddB [Rhodobium gokarnense]MCW2308796.1 ATP-dependent helicase/nuclease subunit B [Rhodobium gokarnense]
MAGEQGPTGGDCGARPRVLTIPPESPFLPTLVRGLFSGELVPGFTLDDDPLALADVRIFVPTRRAARALRGVFLSELGGRAAILPRITPIGDVDGEDDIDEATLADETALPPNIGDLERRLVVSRLVLSWTERVARDLMPHIEGEISIPASPADAARLADDLIRLMDQVATERADWHRLFSLVPEDYARYWQISLEFLKIVTEHWPAYLAERGLADPGMHRDRAIETAARRLRDHPPTGPVIAAGSTGSAPATADLLAAIAHLPNGAVVLPGLDRRLGDDAWEAIGDREAEAAAPSHPQFGMRQLIARIGIRREDVAALGPENGDADRSTRMRLVNEALRPAEATEGWRDLGIVDADIADAFAGVALIEARGEEEEALAVAIALREAVAEKQTAALVTPDRVLARRVARHLLRWEISVDDSAGRPLSGTPPAVLARLLADLALSGFDPVTLLAVLKHPLARFGLSAEDLRHGTRLLEIAVLRGPRTRDGSAGLCAAVAALKAGREAPQRHRHRAVCRLCDADWDRIADLGARIAEALSPLEALGQGPVSVGDLVSAQIQVLNRVLCDDTGALAQLADPAAGTRLAGFLTELSELDVTDFPVAASDWPALLRALMDGIAVRPNIPADPRISIWGPLEARLQSVDRLVLGGLVEGDWPAATRSDPWLSRPMRRDLGLEAPERRIGLAAHDFAQGFGAPRVVLSRSLRKEGAPSVASRWLQRLRAVVGKEADAAMTARGETYLTFARGLDGSSDAARPVVRPEPAPPLAARPASLSVTEIETLIRDPYAIYARHVLRLDPLDEIGGVPDLAERGTVLHAIFADFIRSRVAATPLDGTALDALMEIGRRHFAELEVFPDIHALWWPRFSRIAGAFLDWERARASTLARSFVEIGGSMEIALPDAAFRLRGRADRIDVLADGRLALLDYKTGTLPSGKQVDALLSPQLPLEAAMAERGGFDGLPAGTVAEIAYVALKDARAVDFFQSRGRDGDAEALAAQAVAQLAALVAHYRNPATGYRSRARPMFERRFAGDYDHLARVAEWSLGGGDEA